jgi:hypothetical protein
LPVSTIADRRSHDQDAAGVHEHRRLGVPVGLGADVDAADDHVDLAAPLGELDLLRSTSEIQSMFSVPLSIEILAPAESANHSSGTPIFSASESAALMRRHSGSASDPISLLASPRITTRVIPSGTLAVKLRITPTTMFACSVRRGADLDERAVSSRSCSTNSPAAGRRTRRPRGGEHLEDLVRIDEPGA